MARPRILDWTPVRGAPVRTVRSTNFMFTIKHGSRGWHLYVTGSTKAVKTCATLAEAKESARVGTYAKPEPAVIKRPTTKGLTEQAPVQKRVTRRPRVTTPVESPAVEAVVEAPIEAATEAPAPVKKLAAPQKRRSGSPRRQRAAKATETATPVVETSVGEEASAAA